MSSMAFVRSARDTSAPDAIPIPNSRSRKVADRIVGTSQPKLDVASRSGHFATRMSSKPRDYISDNSEDWEDLRGPLDVPNRSVSSSVSERSIDVSEEDTLVENPTGQRVDALAGSQANTHVEVRRVHCTLMRSAFIGVVSHLHLHRIAFALHHIVSNGHCFVAVIILLNTIAFLSFILACITINCSSIALLCFMSVNTA